MLRVEVTAPDVEVTAPDSSSQLAVPLRLCRKLKLQLTGGELPSRGRLVEWALVFFSCLFWNQELHVYGRVDLADSCGFFPDFAKPVQ